jgi:hypothetical protein
LKTHTLEELMKKGHIFAISLNRRKTGSRSQLSDNRPTTVSLRENNTMKKKIALFV